MQHDGSAQRQKHQHSQQQCADTFDKPPCLADPGKNFGCLLPRKDIQLYPRSRMSLLRRLISCNITVTALAAKNFIFFARIAAYRTFRRQTFTRFLAAIGAKRAFKFLSALLANHNFSLLFWVSNILFDTYFATIL